MCQFKGCERQEDLPAKYNWLIGNPHSLLAPCCSIVHCDEETI